MEEGTKRSSFVAGRDIVLYLGLTTQDKYHQFANLERVRKAKQRVRLK
jgi:hypothetical protein